MVIINLFFQVIIMADGLLYMGECCEFIFGVERDVIVPFLVYCCYDEIGDYCVGDCGWMNVISEEGVELAVGWWGE